MGIGSASGWASMLNPDLKHKSLMPRYEELLSELRTIVFSRGRWLDSILPPIIFLILNAIVEYEIAVAGSLSAAVLIGVYRLLRKEPVRYAFGGAGGVIVAG